MNKINLFLLVMICFLLPAKAATVFSQDGIRLNYDVDKVKTVYVAALKKKVVIWKSHIELFNANKKPVSVTSPCSLYYAFAYLFPSEIAAVRTQLPEFMISDLYKAYATPKPMVLKARQKVSNTQYFATYEDVDLNHATYNLEVKYSF